MKKGMKWGTLVETTQSAIDKNIFPTHRKGIYLGWGKYPLGIYVVCYGQVTPSIYYHSFWREIK